MDTVYKLTGIRRTESIQRMYRYSGDFIVPDDNHRRSFIVHPIKEWSLKDVLKHLGEHGLQEHKGYKICGVSGCFYCPFYSPKHIIRINNVFPGIFDEIIKWEQIIKKPAVNGMRYITSILKQRSLFDFIPANELDVFESVEAINWVS